MFSCQDFMIVVMLLVGKPFDLSHLVLQNMLAAVNQKKIGLPYGLLLTRIFEFFKFNLKSASKMSAKEVLDNKTLAPFNCKLRMVNWLGFYLLSHLSPLLLLHLLLILPWCR